MDQKIVYIAIGGGLFFLFFLWEKLASGRKASSPRQSVVERKFSYLTNLVVWLFNQCWQVFLPTILLYGVANHFSYGLLDLKELTSPLGYYQLSTIELWIVWFLIYDLFIYFWHRINHVFNFLWQFHRCHHSDQDLNTSTAVRFHIGELLLSVGYKSLLIVLFGFSVEFVIFFEFITLYCALFHHSDIKLWGEKYLKYLFVMPCHHNTHHSTERQHHDTNYGVVFSFWDRLFRSYDPFQPKEYGLLNQPKKNWWGTIKFGLTPIHGLVIVLIAAGYLWVTRSTTI